MHVNPAAAGESLAWAGGRRRRASSLVLGVLAVALALGSQGVGGLRMDSGGVSAASVSIDELAALQAPAASLAAEYRANLPGLATAGRQGLEAGRNEASVAAMLRLRWVVRLDAGLERYGAGLASSDTAHLALAVAGVQRYSGLIHSALLNDAPSQLIIVSVQGQHLVAYDHGRVVVDTAVTTGRPALPTDIGAMRVLEKDAPWTMHSPWPPGSADWYPDTPVQMVMWFTRNGEGLHDASWQPAGTYGPGSTNGPYASHGCIHLPLDAERTLYGWAPLGTPVVVYPGDGSMMAAQLAQVSVDAAGNPLTGTRGD